KVKGFLFIYKNWQDRCDFRLTFFAGVFLMGVFHMLQGTDGYNVGNGKIKVALQELKKKTSASGLIQGGATIMTTGISAANNKTILCQLHYKKIHSSISLPALSEIFAGLESA
ncbi:hypothetical protein ACFL1G_01155, partial [Planctomycetota bacterium]